MRRTNGTGAAPGEVLSGEVATTRVLGTGGWGRLTSTKGDVVMGPVLGLQSGDAFEARGRWHTDAKWGRQFKAETIRCSLAGDDAGAIAWLSSRLPGLGEKRAAELVARWGIPGLYEVIATRPEELTAIRGITPVLAQAIHEEHERVKGEAEEMTQLLGWGLTDGQIKRCKEAWGKKVLEVLRADPYRLAEEVYGFGFKRSDEIARRMGLPPDHPRRLRAVCLHVLRDAEGQGHCYLRRNALLKFALEELSAAPSQVSKVAEQLALAADDGRVAVVDEEGGEWGKARVYLAETRAPELAVARWVRRAQAAAA